MGWANSKFKRQNAKGRSAIIPGFPLAFLAF
jgi:hypothetical protein